MLRRSIFVAGTLATSAIVFSESAGRADATPTGIEVGVRTGYALPFGDAVGAPSGGQTSALGDMFSGMIPIWVDAGYRLDPNMMIGASFQYGFAMINSSHNPACSQNGLSCSGSDVMFGVQLHYHLRPGRTIDPWGGLGVGYELASFGSSGNGQSAGTSFGGFQFVNVQVGGDYKVMPNLGVGPFVMFSLGEYSGCWYSGGAAGGGGCTIHDTAMHEWLTFGIRGAYDINL